MSRVVAALGGNALLRRGDPGSIAIEQANLAVAARALVDLVAAGHELVLTHGNGPQVGFLAIEAAAAAPEVPAPPLDVLGAESQGQIGYLLAQAVGAALRERAIEREIAVVLTQTIVAADDPAFARPTKPVGPTFDAQAAQEAAAERGWTVAPDGLAWRRVVPSPRPIRLVEAAAIRTLVTSGVLVIAAGGGGVPVVERPGGGLTGIEAVIDKDLAAVVLAETVGADALLLLTDVDAVYSDWGTAAAAPVTTLSAVEATALRAAGAFAAGSMGPKVQAAAEFAWRTGGLAAIGSLDEARAVLEGRRGTRVERAREPVGPDRANGPIDTGLAVSRR